MAYKNEDVITDEQGNVYNKLLDEYPHNILDELNIKQYRIN